MPGAAPAAIHDLPELKRVGLCALDAELASYLGVAIRARWPAVRFAHARDAAGMARQHPQLWISALLPPPALRVPVLVLGAPATPGGLRRLRAGVWRLTCPYTAAALLPALEAAHQDAPVLREHA